MIRVRTYENALRAVNAPAVQAGAALPSAAGAGRSAENETLNAVLGSGMKLAGLAAEKYVSDEAARVSQSLQRLDADLAAERERYMQENQGESAVDAGAHFESFAASLAQKYLEEGGFQGRFAGEFQRQAMGSVLHFAEQGRDYGERQRRAWNASVLEGALSGFQRQAVQNYDNPDWLEYGYANLERTVNAMRPGLDNAALLKKARVDAALGVIRGYLDHGDTEGAARAAGAYRSDLGENFGRAGAAIRSRAETLREKRRAEEARSASDEKKAQVENLCRSAMAELNELPEECTLDGRRERMDRLTARIGSRERRDRVRTLLRAQLEEQELSRGAKVVEELNNLERAFRAEPGMELADRLSMIRTGDFCEETKRRAEEALLARAGGRSNAEKSALGARRIRSAVDDAGGDMDGRKIARLMLDAGLNFRDRETVAAYAAGSAGLQRRVDAAVDEVFGRSTSDITRARIFAALWNDADIRNGGATDDDALKKRVRSLGNLAAAGPVSSENAR